MPALIAGGKEILPKGRYVLKIEKVGDLFRFDDGSGKVPITFLHGKTPTELQGKQWTWRVNASLGRRSSLYALVSGALGRDLKPGERFEICDLEGYWIDALVDVEEYGGAQFNTITVIKTKAPGADEMKAKEAERATKQAVEEAEAGWANVAAEADATEEVPF